MDLKYLPYIKSPKDLKNYSKKELEAISSELREYIVSTVSEIGGHLASTLGVIELTTAFIMFTMHLMIKLFGILDTKLCPKVLTGRFESLKLLENKIFKTFLKKSESKYDVFGQDMLQHQFLPH
ncbi:MAG: hypothetical protein CM1200mP31_3440 [Candidatus Neomarinimicrobiota bacterium]|nr:MAG: hypothetical protein CM1200mP31_3440 [Candidatus Neomarinimicrobiota bacterium]